MLKTLVSILATLTLAGCATTEATIAPSAGASVQNNPEPGAVALRLTVSGPEVGSWFEFWTNLSVSRVEPGKEDMTYQVGLSRLGAIGSASYFGALPLRTAVRDNAAAAERSYRAVQTMTMGNLNGVATPGGSVLFNNYSGSLRQVSWPAAVRAIATGLLSRANTVPPLSDLHWIVAGDFGEARLTRDGGATWRDAALNPPYGAVRALYKGKGEELLAFIEQENALELYHGSAGGPWTRLSSSPFSWDKMKGGIARPALVALDDRSRVLVAIPSGKSYVLDTATYGRSQFELPGAAVNVGLSADGVLRCRCNKTGLWVSTWESRDGGKSWQDSSLSRMLPLPHYATASTAFNTDGFNLMRSVDGGKSWKQTLAQKEAYWPFFMQPYEMRFIPAGGQRVVATDTLDKLLGSDDNGATWHDITAAQ